MKRRIQQYFITGLLVWLPMGITVWILMWLMGMLDGIFLAVLGAADAVIPGIHPLVERLRNVPGLGVILVAVVIFSTGVFVANMFGQWWVGQWDKLMNRIPWFAASTPASSRSRTRFFREAAMHFRRHC
jgi:uncharacterized membrane protein